MNKHTDLKVVAYAFQALGVIALLIALWYTALTQSIFFMIYGLISFIWLYAIGGALLILIDIAKSVRVSAVVAVEQEQNDRRKAKPKADKSLGLKHANPEKRRTA